MRPASRASASRRCAADSTAVPRATMVARHSDSCPAVIAANVCGNSWCNACANPTSRSPRCGDSRRASATCAFTPPATRSGRAPAASKAARCDAAKATVTRA